MKMFFYTKIICIFVPELISKTKYYRSGKES